jgi:hypothetical protein
MCQLLRCVDVNFCQFLNESYIVVLFPSLIINDVISTI